MESKLPVSDGRPLVDDWTVENRHLQRCSASHFTLAFKGEMRAFNPKPINIKEEAHEAQTIHRPCTSQ